MKKLYPIFLLFLFTCKTSNASHVFGGEISWKCLGSGQYVFTLKLYRDCSGIGMSCGEATELNVYNHPSICSIPLNLNCTITDLTTTNCGYNCSTLDSRSAELFTWESLPITISGVPPDSGWIFSFDNCCRAAMNNITMGDFSVRAVMYSYNGMDANPCFDSSPHFVQAPYNSTVGYNFNYIPFAMDADMDSVAFSLDTSRGQPTNLCPLPFNATYIGYAAPFNPQNQISGIQSFDSTNGTMEFLNLNTIGNYAMCTSVSSYKCGVKLSSVYRDIGFQFLPPINLSGGGINTPPDIYPPFIDASTGLQTSFSDTIFAGDTIDFNLLFSDFEAVIPGQVQAVSSNLIGTQVSPTGIDTNNCKLPPCLVTSAPLPLTNNLVTNIHCFWQTTNDHLGLNYVCAYMPNTYFFLTQYYDNVCPINAKNANIISITVLPTVPRPLVSNSGGSLTVNATGYNYQWYANRFPVVGATNQSHSPAFNASYQCRIIDPATGAGNYSERVLINTLVDNLESKYNLVVYPNPTAENITVQLNNVIGKNIQFKMINSLGQLVYESNFKNNNAQLQQSINCQTIANGNYKLLIDVDGDVQTKDVVVQR